MQPGRQNHEKSVPQVVSANNSPTMCSFKLLLGLYCLGFRVAFYPVSRIAYAILYTAVYYKQALLLCILIYSYRFSQGHRLNS